MPAYPAAPAPATAALDLPAVGLVAFGGGLGSLARYGLSRAFPAHPGSVDWTILAVNLVGSLLLGALVVAVTEIWRANRLVRPALGTGVLGGFTTFSTFAVEIRGSAAATAWAYLALSVVGGVLAAVLGMLAMRAIGAGLGRASRPVDERAAVDPIDPELP
ncbi:MAG: putative fluoride ion transporter CrcB 2 [Frankiales bacterium]|nr:putative fluoride ion transporter CrcB 2 [Frankiales bacterium]